MALLPLQFICSATAQCCAVLLPAYLYAATKRSKPIAKAASLTLVLLLLQAAVLAAPNLGMLAALHYNWIQKLAMIGLTFGAAALLGHSKSDCGFGAATSKKAYGFAIIIGLIDSVVVIADDFLNHDFSKITTESFLFELSLPGLEEEPLYRGLLLSIWDKAIGRPIRILGVNFGWGSVLSALLFTFGHLCAFDKNFHFTISRDILSWLNLITWSMVITWLRYRFNSVWPGVVAHNVGNILEIVSPLSIAPR